MRKLSGIGGQALIEGIMMKNGREYALGVRLPGGSIHVEKDTYDPVAGEGAKKIPLVRGAVTFIDSLILGISTLMRSSLLSVEEEEEADGAGEAEAGESPDTAEAGPGPEAKALEASSEKKAMTAGDKAMMGGVLLVSLAIAIVLFILLPVWITNLCRSFTESPVLLAVIEGAVKMVIFLAYLFLISRMKDVRRTFMYHGAEHKCINCVETGHELTVDQVREASRFHKRCGTSFLFYVVIISVIIGFFIQSGNTLLRVVLRIALLPVVAGISYEFIRFAGMSDSKVSNALSRPGLAMQRFTTQEPTDDMIEVAIKATEAVFDWRQFLADWEKEEPGACRADTGEK